MNILNKLTSLFGPKVDMLGFAPNAKPSAHQWIQAFTNDFMGHADGEHATQALMSGLRFYTQEFLAEIGAPPALGPQEHKMAGNIPKRVYASTGPIIVDVYQRLIRHGAPRAEVQAEFARAMPVLMDHYTQKTMH